MEKINLKNRVINATKWSSITEITVKIISPITSMILARILTPEEFGVVASVTMIISFAEMFMDAGFQKYMIQHEFKDDNEKYNNSNIAFWTNFVISLFLWGFIAIFCEPIASLVGNPGLGIVITIASIQLPLTAFSSIQMALYKRDFDFKILFFVRLVAICIPFVVTIPLAILGFNFWSLIIGAICGQISNAIILTVKSKWKPKWFYNFDILKKMLSFSIWSLIEAFSIWLTTWVDVFVIGSILSGYYLGLYKTSLAMVNSLFALITGATTPILFSALARLQNKNEQFNQMFYKMQRLISILVFPLGIGVYLYKDLATQILLGNQWNEASGVIGVWALTSAIMIVFGHYCSEVYRAKGRPKLSFLAQMLHLVILVPVCIISARYGFWPLVYARSWIRMEAVIVHFILMKIVIGFPILKMLYNVFPTFIAAIVMGIGGYFLREINDSLIWSFISIIICSLIYFGVLSTFPNVRKEIVSIVKRANIQS